jgi:RimJ/RimL family protein N-acetyltransferase
MVSLIRASEEDARLLYQMQLRAFRRLLAKYRDYATSPANEPMTRTIARLRQENTEYYIVLEDGAPVGGLRIRRYPERVLLGPLFVVPERQGRGIMQAALREIERAHPEARVWELETIAEEAGNCYLYEKMGYRLTGESEVVNERMTLVWYRKEVRSTGPDGRL